MKRILFAFLIAFAATACYDDSYLRKQVDENRQSIIDLQALIGQPVGSLPELKIEDGHLYVSYNKGEEWEDLGAVSSPSEDCVVTDAVLGDTYVKLTLSTGTQIKVPLYVEQTPDAGETDGVKSYYMDEIAKTKASLYSLMNEPCIVFPLITDVHYLATTSLRPELIDVTMNNMIELAKDIRFDCLISMGDIVQGTDPMEETSAEVRHVYEQFRRLGVPLYSCIGNHDTNIYYKIGEVFQKDHVFTLGQLYNLYMRDICGVSYDMASSGTNYYKDFPEFNTRFIFLNSNEGDTYGHSDETLAWFRQAMDSERETYIFSHRKCSTTSTYHNDAAMAEIIKNSENFRMFFYGHVHYDCEFATPFAHESTPYLAFAQNAHKCYNHELKDTAPAEAVIPKRVVDTVDEDCFDIVVIRPHSQKVNLVRFGAGVDREFNLKTGRSMGESVASTLPEEISIELDFSKGWPFAEPVTAKEDQFHNGELYTYTYTYDYEGMTKYWDVEFYLSRDKIDGFDYSYENGCLCYNANGLTNSSNSYGIISIPYMRDRYLKSIAVTNDTADKKRFTVRKGFNTTPGKKDYTTSFYVAAGKTHTFTFPLTASDNATLIAPGMGTGASGLKDYALRMRDADTKVSKIVFTYSKTKPE